VRLDELVAQQKVAVPHIIKIDVEGAELQVLAGASEILAHWHPTVFLATHGTPVHEQCCNLLTALGYQLQPLDNRDIDTTRELMALFP
jgi:hypothetical protein